MNYIHRMILQSVLVMALLLAAYYSFWYLCTLTGPLF